MNINRILQALFVSLFVLCIPQTAYAQFTQGTVVQLVNRSTGKAAAANAMLVGCADRNVADYSQLWYVESRSYNAIPIGYKVRLRNLGNGHYLQGNNNSSTPWRLVKSTGTYTENYDGQSTRFTTELWEASRDGYYTLGAENKSTGNSDYYYDKLHSNAEGSCVSWMGSADASLWSIELVTGVDVQGQWNRLAEFENMANRKDEFQGYLNTLFTDELCTELRSAYKSQSALLASSAYQALPAELKAMALKVCNGDWAEVNKDNSNVSWTNNTAKRFRVQTIEPHSVAEEICKVVNVGAYSNMNNPTGLYAGNMDMLYIMVKGDIRQGAALYLAGLAHNSKGYLTTIAGSNPVQLAKGLNVVPFYGNKDMLYLLYSVNSQSSSYPLANYPDIEVHIEGGSINGMYDASMDDASRFSELAANASKAGLEYYDVLGGKFVYRTSWETVFKNNSASSVDRALAVWDMIGQTQHMVMGISSAAETASDPLGLHTYTSDFSRSFNNRQLVHSLPTIGAYTQMPFRIQFAHGEGMLRGDDMERSNYIWVCAHEFGHSNQNAINMVGTTEISNNLFSNVAIFYQDYLHTRGGTIADNNKAYRDNVAWHFRDADSRMRMMYQLWLYYHAAGRNRAFFPKLFEYLRNDPMSIRDASSGDVYTSGESLKFYKYACRAAGEDLTPFFEAWGFFVPFAKSTITDYYDYNIISQESDINAAKNEVAGYGYRKNYSVIFIEDRIGTVASKKYPSHNKQWIGTALNTGSLGQYTDYANSAPASGEFVWVQESDNAVKVAGGSGAVGVMLEWSGRMHAFYNDVQLQVDAATMEAIKSGECKIKVIGADQSVIVAKNVSEASGDEAKRVMLKSMIDKVNEIKKYVDTSYKRVGYYNPAYTQGLMLLYDKAVAVHDRKVASEYMEYIDKLAAEIAALEQLGDRACIGIDNGAVYMLDNIMYQGYYMYLGSNNEVDGKTVPYGDVASWVFEKAADAGSYYIKSRSNNCYLGVLNAASRQVYASEASTSSAGVFRVELCDDRSVAIGGASHYLHLDAAKNVVGWNKDAEASHWNIRLAVLSDADDARLDMEVMLQGVKWLVEEIATGATFGSNASVSGIVGKYAGLVELQELVAACRSVGNAQSLGNSSYNVYVNMYAELYTHYLALKKVYDMGNDTELKSARLALVAVMDEVRATLLGNTGAGKLQMQCTDRTAANYISSNAEHNAGGAAKDGGGLPALIDGSAATYFHSRWAGTMVGEPHFLQVDMGDGNSVSDFCFNYLLREGSPHAIPTGIVVSGSNDGVGFETILTLGREELTGDGARSDADYSLNSNFATVIKQKRKITSVQLNSPGYGVQRVDLTNPKLLYSDMTATAVFNVLPGETVTASFVKDGEWDWMHGYIYIDADSDGFESGIEGYKPGGDLVAYSFYGSETNEDNGYNSVGNYIFGDGRNVLDPPAFVAPTAPGVYRMRYKIDWNSIDPKGDNNSNFGGTIAKTDGCIVDVMLRVGDVASQGVKENFVSDTISCGKDYRYLRFTVTESDCFVDSHSCTSTYLQYNGQYFFCISEFGLTRIENTDPAGTWLPLYANDAETLLAKAERTLGDASTAAQFERCTAQLQLMSDTLRRALATPLPVELTPSVDLPVFYRIVSALGNSPLEYETVATPNEFDASGSALNQVAFAGSDENVRGQAWYFMRGTDVGRYYICPQQGNGKVLGTTPAWGSVMQAGDGRVWSVEKDAPGCVTEWSIVVLESGECLLKPVYATSLLLGRYNQLSQKLGFVDDASALNARFVIEKAVFDFTSIGEDVVVERDDAGVMYDIYGRRVERVTVPGCYIVDGCKVYLRP
ncbi:MAG: M60 family metallopeptidase [Bacteroidaceae bacterium]|nr:M60 family metallopeptidase [Bacteroidaceae bacterium]